MLSPAISAREHAEDLVVLREAAFALLGEHELAVYEHVELRLRALDDLGLRGRARSDLGRETRGPAVIPASDRAVMNFDPHAGNLPGRPLGTPESPAYTRLV
jgi:hypothetical protein